MQKKTMWAKLVALCLLFLVCGVGWTPANAQEAMAEGYYYISRTNGNGLFLYQAEDVAEPWRIQEGAFAIPVTPTKAEAPYIFEVKQYGEGFSVKSLSSGQYWGRQPNQGRGEGLGWVDSPVAFDIVCDASQLGYSVQNMEESNRYWVMSWGDGCASYTAQGNTGVSRFWEFTAIPQEQIDNIDSAEGIVEVEDGSVEDGYYYISLPYAGERNGYLVPVEMTNFWYLGSLPLVESDNSFIFHISKLENGNYRIKNCGSQSLTYFSSYVKGDANSPQVFMNGNMEAENSFKFYSDGSVTIYTTDNANNLRVNNSGMIENHPNIDVNSYMKLIPVPESKVTAALRLQEVITDAKGLRFEAGINPGQLPNAAYDEFSASLSKAEAASAGSEDAAIEELKAAIVKAQANVIPLADGYYRICNQDMGTFFCPVWKTWQGETGWWLGHIIADETDPATIWHITTASDGSRIMKNCGNQDSSYFKASAGGNAWGLIRMTGTQRITHEFIQEYSNVYRIFGSDNTTAYRDATIDYVCTTTDFSPSVYWNILKVDESEITAFTRLHEVIADAAGAIADMRIGADPGMAGGDPSALNAAIAKARAAFEQGSASDSEVEALIAELTTALADFNAQDHSPVGIVDGGYYYMVNAWPTWLTGYNKAEVAMYATDENTLKWSVFNPNDPTYVFKFIKKDDDSFYIQNLQYENYVGNQIKQNTPIPMTSEPMVAQMASNISGSLQWNIYSAENMVSYHTGDHNSGNASNGNVVIWNGGLNSASAWYIRRITDEELIERLRKEGEQNRVIRSYEKALAVAQPALKAVYRYNSNRDLPLITEADNDDPEHCQFWASQEPDAKGNYSNYSNLIDGNHGTCFQSTWNASVAAPPQPFQVDLRDHPVSDFEFYFGLRDGSWGMKELWTDVTLYATNDPDVASEATVDPEKWNKIGDYSDLPTNFDYNGNNRGFYYQIRNMGDKYRFLRFLVNKTYEPQGNMMYTLGEFQVYEVAFDEVNSPYAYVPGLKEASDKLSELIDQALQKIADRNATLEDVEALQAAAQVVLDMTPNTDPIEAELAAIKKYIASFDEGTEWGDVSSEEWTTIQEAIETAEAYDHEKPLRSDLDTRLANLQSAFALYKSQQLMPEPNKWYYIVNTDQSRPGDRAQGGTGDIWGTWVDGTVIYPASANTREAHYESDYAIAWGYAEHIADGAGGHATIIDDSRISNPICQWRLVEIEGKEGQYAIQNRMTGYYMGVFANHYGRNALTATPVPYTVSLLKSGQLSIVCADPANTDKRPLHASGDGWLCSWEGGADSPSSWTLEEVPGEDDLEFLEVEIPNNYIGITTLPFAFDNEDIAELNSDNGIETYTIKGISADGTELELTKKTTFEAGEPFIIAAGDYEAYDEDNITWTSFAIPSSIHTFVTEAKTVNGLVGALDYTPVGKSGYGVIFDAVLQASTAETCVDGQSGYINPSLIVYNDAAETDAVVKISSPLTGVKSALAAKKAAGGNIYTIDGRLVKKNVSADKATQGLQKGIYIVKGKKVVVK